MSKMDGDDSFADKKHATQEEKNDTPSTECSIKSLKFLSKRQVQTQQINSSYFENYPNLLKPKKHSSLCLDVDNALEDHTFNYVTLEHASELLEAS